MGIPLAAVFQRHARRIDWLETALVGMLLLRLLIDMVAR